ncbi:MAG: M48 family metallopeptidase, partial [Gammaproteobacteria bacterium]
AISVSAPIGMKASAVRTFALTKLSWIRKHQKRMQEQAREPARQYVEMETHYVWGYKYLLSINETAEKQGVSCEGDRLTLHVRPNANKEQRAAVYEAWARDQLRTAAEPLIAQWASTIQVAPERLFVQKMKTQWGSCNTTKRNIRLNTELVKKPKELLELVVVHELVHLLERNHTPRFYQLMSKYLPTWAEKNRQLNALPISY